MAWVAPSIKAAGRTFYLKEVSTLPASATTEYSSVLPKTIEPNPKDGSDRKVAFSFNASAVSGTNLDIGLYGSATAGGTKVLLLDAVVADITATGKATGIVNLNDYPANFYYLGWTSDADESANEITVEIEGVKKEYL